MHNNDDIEVPVWYSNGGMMIRRDSLNPSHPESTYNYIKNVLGKCPENYGYYSSFLSQEQIDLLSTIPSDALVAEVRRREHAIMNEEIHETLLTL